MSAAAPFEELYPGYAQENKGPLILTVTATLTGLCLLFVLSRLYSRMISIGKLAFDDFVVIVCICLSISYVGLAAVAIQNGGGRHASTLTPAQITSAVYYTVVSFVPGVLSFIIPKFAVVILLAKLLNPSRKHIIVMWTVSLLYFTLAMGMLVINFVQCQPAAAQWGGAAGTCWNRQITVDYALTLGICSAVFDFYLAIYPTAVLYKLQMNWKKKVALASSLGFGYCAGAVTIYKCTTLIGLITLVDFTYAVDDVVLWTNIEANCVLIGACIPTLYPLVKRIFGSSALGGSYPTGGSSGPKKTGDSNTVVTIGSYPTKNKRKGRTLSQFDTIDEGDSKYIILEERSFGQSTAEMRPEDLSVLEQGRGIKQQGW